MIETMIFYILIGGGSAACLITLKKWMESVNYNDHNDHNND